MVNPDSSTPPATAADSDTTPTAPPMAHTPTNSSTSSSFNLSVPMPTAGMPTSPSFNGHRIHDFLDGLEQHADSAHLSHDQLPQYVLRYCTNRVRQVIESATHIWSGTDWLAARLYLINLYESNDRTPKPSSERLRKWTERHGQEGSITSLRDVDRYNREFTLLAGNLVASGLLLQIDANWYFYRGIPESLRTRVKRRIPTANQKRNSLPQISELLRLLRAEFDDEDADYVTEKVSLRVEAETDDEDADDADAPPPVKRPKKKVAFAPTEKTVPAAPPVDPQAATIDELTRKMQELLIATAQLKRAQGLPPQNNFPDASANSRRCFMCGLIDAHRPGPKYCLETMRLIDDGLIKYNREGRIELPDGSPLPRATSQMGGVAQAVRELKAETTVKGKVHEQPPHMRSASCASFVYDDQEIGTIFESSAASPVPDWRAAPVTRSQKDSVRMDPTKRPAPKAREPPLLPRTTPSRRDEGKTSTDATPPPTKPPVKTRAAPKVATVPTPPPVNTREGYKDAQKARRTPRPDAEMADPSKSAPNVKGGPAYHFTSTVQESVDMDRLQEKILSTAVTVTVRDLIGCSPELQRRFANLTKTRREYNDKPDRPVTAHLVESFEDDYDIDYATFGDEYDWSTANVEYDADAAAADEDYSEEITSPALSQRRIEESLIKVDYDPAEDDDQSIYRRYASAIRVIVEPLFAMVTGRFQGKFNGHAVYIMIDTGSELNIVGPGYGMRSVVGVEERDKILCIYCLVEAFICIYVLSNLRSYLVRISKF
ncbi:hypothetical protein LshimejAT787_0602280 [Lyophyllum shimeji]|uniref:DUF4100 domain-containing protein n=1 Tax=Lyophyllum shimeji TaxID=47721 RepID=A0A9P3PNW7_LYOSH|nr:hypothetical protein LshimejAT787_0602280 [Lyophyllum shimeji]